MALTKVTSALTDLDGGITIDNITIDGTEIDLSSGELTIDVAGDIILDADGGDFTFKDGGTTQFQLQNSSGDVQFVNNTQDKDIKFMGDDGGSTITALTLDMSEAGAATFNSSVTHKGSTASSASNFISSWQNTGQSYFGYLYADSGGTGIFSNTTTSIAEGIYFQNSTDKTFFYNQGVARGEIDGSGNMIMAGNITAFGTVSDIKLKKDIKVIENPIKKIKNLKGVTFTYKKNGEKSTGLIAQDLEKVLPEAVYKTHEIDLNGDSEDEHLAIRYGNTVGLLVEAIKELEARVKELENK